MVAGLLATSVTEVTIRDEMRMISHMGSDPKGVNLLPIQFESFETYKKELLNTVIYVCCYTLNIMNAKLTDSY